MERERFIQTLVGPRRKCVLLACAVSTLFLSQAVMAQSGRRLSKSAPPPAPTEQKSPTIDPEKVKAPARISNVIVAGDLVESGKRFSNYVDIAVDACVSRLKEEQQVNVKGSGSMKRLKAEERAKEETDSYLLWLEIRIVDSLDKDLRIQESICIINYYVFMPQTGKILAEGRVSPNYQDINNRGVVLRLPRSSKRLPLTIQLEEGGRAVADHVREKLE